MFPRDHLPTSSTTPGTGLKDNTQFDPIDLPTVVKTKNGI